MFNEFIKVPAQSTGCELSGLGEDSVILWHDVASRIIEFCVLIISDLAIGIHYPTQTVSFTTRKESSCFRILHF